MLVHREDVRISLGRVISDICMVADMDTANQTPFSGGKASGQAAFHRNHDRVGTVTTSSLAKTRGVGS